MLLLCTKNVHVSYNYDIYIQRDGVAIGSPLGPVLAGILMVNLERSLVPKLNVYINFWRRYVDDTITFVKIGSVEYLLSVLSNFHPKIKFTYEMEVESKLAFLDILLHRDGHDIITTVYRKVTNNDVYLNWSSFCPREWKQGTFRSLVQRAYIICSSSHLLKEELKHLEDVFVMKNNFPIWVVKKILKEEKEKIDNRNNADKNKHTIQTDVKFESKDKSHLLLLPYQGEKGLHLTKSLKRNLKSLLPSTVKANIGFTGKKLSTCFQIKNQTKFEHKHDIIYLAPCPEDNCSENYIGESGRRISERIIDHNGRDQKSHIFKHSSEKCRQHFHTNSFKIIGNGFKNNSFKRKVSEALLIKEIKPSLNIQEKSIELKIVWRLLKLFITAT